LNREGTLYAIEKESDKRSIGTVEFTYEILDDAYKFTSFAFNITVPEEDAREGISFAEWCADVVARLVVSAFETIDVESVIINCELSEDIINLLTMH